jgi:hypothetical protein
MAERRHEPAGSAATRGGAVSTTGELSPATHYHVGYVVADLEATMESVGRALGVTWAPLRDGNRLSDRTRRVSTPEGARDVRFRVAYSLEGPPYIELIEEVPGTLWVPPDSGAHHIGRWSDEVRSDAAALDTAGCALVAWAESDRPGAWRWAYHRNPAGGYVEIVDRAVAADATRRPT